MTQNKKEFTILVVDDNPAGLYATSKTLQQEGFNVIAVAKGRDALEKAKLKPNVILLDVKLPDISGFEVCKILKADTALSVIPVIHLSATYLDDEHKALGLDIGADAYLTHPVEPRVLTATINAMIRIRQAEAKLKAAALKWQTTFDVISDGICLVNETGHITQCNKSFYGVYSKEEDKLTGQPLCSLPELERFDNKFFQDMIEKKIQHLNRVEVFVNNFWYMISVDAVIEDQEMFSGFIFKLTDITSRKEYADRLKATAEDLERSNNELQQFAYVASHDLQEPLRMVASYTQMLERRYKGQLDENADKFIAFAIDGSKRMQSLIRDLLEYSRITTKGKQFVPVNLQEVMDTVISNLEVSIKENSAVINYANLPKVTADPTQLGQLFQNLISNAIKFRRADNPEITISALRRPNEWQFCVKDNGIGIDPQFKDRIFEIFQQLHTKEEYSGTGIGLSICKKIVERHKGKIWVESHKDRGSKFCFTIPS